MTIKRVGLIGVGLMGHGIGKNILAKGYELTVMAHQKRGPVEDLVAHGAQFFDHPGQGADHPVDLRFPGVGSKQNSHQAAAGSGNFSSTPRSPVCVAFERARSITDHDRSLAHSRISR